MDRIIQFRGRIVGTKEWVYGSLVAYPDGEYNILTSRSNHSPKMDDWLVEVDTIGQFTGLCDKNGREIYEGDILLFRTDIPIAVVFHNGAFGYFYTEDFVSFVGNANFKFYINGSDESFEIIGNIHDNPELLRKEDDR